MQRQYALAYLTTVGLEPPDVVSAAAETGYDAVGFRLLPAAPGGLWQRLHEDAAMLRETVGRCRATGIAVYDLEIIRLNERFKVADYGRFMAAGQELGARAILVAGDDPDPARLTASFAALCQAAAGHGLTCDLEFMPWTEVPDVAAASRVVGAAAQPNGRILVDALHFARSGSSLAEISAIPRSALGYMQLCDAAPGIPATVEEMIFTARAERMLPGRGGIDLPGLLNALPGDLPVSVEVPSDSNIRALGQVEWARRALHEARAVVAAAAGAE